MKFKFIFLKHFQTNYFEKLNSKELIPILNEINQENKYKQFNHLKTCVLFTEISEQMIVLKNHLNFYSELEKLLKEKYEHIPYYYLFDSLHKEDHAFKSEKIIYCSYMLILIYWMFIQGNNIRNTEWFYNKNKGLFLTGKTWRPNRGPLLFEFWKNNLTKDLLWSFYDTKDKLAETKNNLLRNCTDEEFQLFLNDCIRIIDLDYRKDVVDSSISFMNNGYPLDISVYADTSFSIISETHYQTVTTIEGKKYPMLSEKTYKAIINYHPFILAGAEGILDKLASMGFKTFTQYLDYPDYLKNDLVERAKLICANVKTFGKKCIDYQQQIKNDVLHNVELLESLCQNEVDNLLSRLNTDTGILDLCILSHKLPLYRY